MSQEFQQAADILNRLLNVDNIFLSRLMNNPVQKYPEEMYEIVNNYYKDEFKSSPDKEMSELLIKLWSDDNTGNFPTKEQIINEMYRTRCHCSTTFNEQVCKQFFEKYIYEYGRKPTCEETELCSQFYVINKTFPSKEEMIEFYRNILEFSHDPEEYYQKDKKHIPVSNLDKIQIKIYDEEKEECCSICQENIIKGQKYIELPCGHMFHGDDKECLEEASIISWMEKEKHCPNCKTEIKLI